MSLNQNENTPEGKELDFKGHFPQYKPRKEQEEAIRFALDSFVNQNKRFVILELPTGVGKSHSAYCIDETLKANKYPGPDSENKDYEKGSWFLTTQKILQNQYIKDFGAPKGEMKSLKSASNYECSFFKKNNCSESLKLLKSADSESRFYKSCQFGCVYRQAKRYFLKSPKSVTNFPFFLISTSFQEDIKPRELLVVDEAHNIEDELSKHIEVIVSEKFSKDILKVKMPSDADMGTQLKAHKWIKEVYFPKAIAVEKDFAIKIEELSSEGKDDTDEMRKIQKRHDLISKHTSKILQFIKLYDKDNWVFNMVPAFSQSMRKLEFKPIDVGAYAEEKLFRFGKKVLMMSATILNKEAFCESIGIKPEDAAFLSVDSPFPVENRQVFYMPVGKMTMDCLAETLPNMTAAVDDIMQEHSGDKGIIHSRSYKIAKYLIEKVPIKNRKRLLTHDSFNRDEIIQEFMDSKKSKVLVSPSSTEGLDLKGEMSRFQIICKIEFPYLGDKLVKKRMNKHKRWYAYQAAKSLVQSIGRSVRSVDDYASTYILDSSFSYFYEKNKDLFPEYFKKSIIEL